MRKWAWLLCLLLLLPLQGLAEDEEEEEWVAPGWVENDVLILPEGITALGWYTGEWIYDPATEEWDLQEDPALEALFEGAYSFDQYLGDPAFSSVRWPSTFRYLGADSLYGYHFRELTLPATLEIICDFPVGAQIDVLRIETTLPWEQVGEIRWDGNGMDNLIGAFEAPEGHPLYRTVDGVLFSGDGKTLLCYPSGRTDTHYDVPKGVEAIADWAFCSEYLQTVTLPIGLRSVGDYGFSGCTRLQSIALPLTVEEIGEDIFYDCVSLELVSLPEGLRADKDEGGYYENDSVYRGDNGDTETSGDPFNEDAVYGSLYANGRVKETAPLYKKSDSEITYGTVFPGPYWLSWYENSRVLLREALDFREVGWVDLEFVECMPGETLFAWADVQPRREMSVWFDDVPDRLHEWPAWEVKVPPGEYAWEMYGPYIVFEDEHGLSFACRVQDAVLTRMPDGTENVYAIAYNEDVLQDVPLYDRPGGDAAEWLIGGAQLRVLAEEDGGYTVTTGYSSGWLAKDNVKIIPEKQEGN